MQKRFCHFLYHIVKTLEYYKWRLINNGFIFEIKRNNHENSRILCLKFQRRTIFKFFFLFNIYNALLRTILKKTIITSYKSAMATLIYLISKKIVLKNIKKFLQNINIFICILIFEFNFIYNIENKQFWKSINTLYFTRLRSKTCTVKTKVDHLKLEHKIHA